MSEIARDVPPLQQNADLQDVIRYVEKHLRRQQKEIWQLRQFIEPAVKLNENAPDQQFNPLE